MLYSFYDIVKSFSEESSDMIFDEFKITDELKVDYDELQDEMVVKISTPSLELVKKNLKKS